MRVENQPHTLEMNIIEIDANRRDIHVEVRTSVNGFSGQVRCWIDEEEFKSFAASVLRLYESFAGIAELSSMSPGEFLLTLSPINPRGYILVNTALTKLYWVDSRCRRVSISGEFEIELAMLSQFVRWSERPDVD
jgi:hypothetical protein